VPAVTRPDSAERPAHKARVHLRSLGCPKNRIDSEVMLGALALAGYAIAESIDEADVALVNTCSFIESAREESIEAILEVAERRERGQLRALVVAGCLPQRYGAALSKELPEVDAFVGTGEFQNVAHILDAALSGRSRGVYVEAGRTHLYDEADPRLLIGPTHTAYVKIAEGCNRPCAFCAIPGIRGRFQSRTLESVRAEAEQLAAAGVKEINLVAQDSTAWGIDLPGRERLPGLLRALDAVEGIEWIRLLYVYPSAVTDELCEVLATGSRVLPYVDVPLQHASDPLLRAMKRGVTEARQRALVDKLRAAVPNLTLRTTFIVGFPGERDADFERLCDFVRDCRFDRVGIFRYSDEEGTAARDLPNKVPRAVARARFHRLGEIQSAILSEKLEAQIGGEARVLVDAVSSSAACGRLASQAPEIDGAVLLKGDARVGALVPARIVGRRGVDLEAEVLPA
jgi:ribosomal protein S12 methylthiotransferase